MTIAEELKYLTNTDEISEFDIRSIHSNKKSNEAKRELLNVNLPCYRDGDNKCGCGVILKQ